MVAFGGVLLFRSGRACAATTFGVLIGLMTPPAWADSPAVQQLPAQVAALQQAVSTLQNVVNARGGRIPTLQNSVNALSGALCSARAQRFFNPKSARLQDWMSLL